MVLYSCKVENQNLEEIAASWGGENIVISFRPLIGQAGKTLIRFGGDIHGLHLTLVCE